MVMKTEAPIMAGYLLLPPQGLLSQLKKWQKKYCKLYRSSSNGLARLEVYDSEEQALKHSTTRNIVLDSCIKIAQEPQKHQPFIIAITTRSDLHHIATVTGQELNGWLVTLQDVAFNVKTDSLEGLECEEDNVLYYGNDSGIFIVQVVQNEAADRCHLKGSYVLVLGSTSLMLRLDRDGKILYVWPYKYIRRYGHGDGKFIFEAGRHCDSGEGVFKFLYHKSEEIHNSLAETLRNIQRMESTTSTGPLPTRSDSLGSLPSIPPDQGNNEPTLPVEHPVVNVMTKPKKPPRKGVKSVEKKSADNVPDDLSVNRPPLPNPRRSSDSPEPFYDSITMPKDAWKTLGVNDVHHTETAPLNKTSQLKDYSLITELKSNIKFEKPEGMKIVPLTLPKTPVDESYDHLQHFGVQSPSTPNKPFVENPLSNEHVYRRVEHSNSRNPPPVDEGAYATYNDELNLSTCRLADDSHMGYATIQKKNNAANKDENLMHYDCNGSEYAIISKT